MTFLGPQSLASMEHLALMNLLNLIKFIIFSWCFDFTCTVHPPKVKKTTTSCKRRVKGALGSTGDLQAKLDLRKSRGIAGWHSGLKSILNEQAYFHNFPFCQVIILEEEKNFHRSSFYKHLVLRSSACPASGRGA